MSRPRRSQDTAPSGTPILIHEDDLPRLQRCIALAAGGRDEAAAEALDAEIARGAVIPDAEMPLDVVTMGTHVVFEDEERGTRRAVTLVFPEDADADAGRVSVLAPIGAALLGLRVGQRIEWGIPNGRTMRLRVLSVERTLPNAAA